MAEIADVGRRHAACEQGFDAARIAREGSSGVEDLGDRYLAGFSSR
jgi:hypothetical protein